MKNEYRGNKSYKRYNNQRRRGRQAGTSPVLWVISGVLLIVLVAAIVIFIKSRDDAGQPDTNPPEHDPSQSIDISDAASPSGAVPTDGSAAPDDTPTGNPATDPLGNPTGSPSGDPNGSPTTDPSGNPTGNPATNPSGTPTTAPSAAPATPPEQQENYIIVLDPGHGASFTGAYYNKKAEKTLALSIAQYAKAYLEENYKSFTVYLTREDDTVLDSNRDKDIELRVAKAAEVEADIFVSLHLNATDAHKKHGVEIMCPHRASVKKEAFRLADCLLAELTALGLKNNGPEIVYSQSVFDADGKALEGLLVNRYTADHGIVGVIIEHCYMDNETDAVFIQDEAALQALGEADARGIAAYFGY